MTPLGSISVIRHSTLFPIHMGKGGSKNEVPNQKFVLETNSYNDYIPEHTLDQTIHWVVTD